MGAVKDAASLMECDYCGQLVMFDTITTVNVQDGPDDSIEQGMCEDCAQAYEECFRDEPEEEEEQCDEKITQRHTC